MPDEGNGQDIDEDDFWQAKFIALEYDEPAVVSVMLAKAVFVLLKYLAKNGILFWILTENTLILVWKLLVPDQLGWAPEFPLYVWDTIFCVLHDV